MNRSVTETADGLDLAIEIRGLRKVYDSGKDAVTAVDGLDLSVRRGEVFGLLGPNGAGKTTTVEICEGLLEATSGEVSILGKSWARNGQALRERIGVSLQETKFLEKQTVWELLQLFASFYGNPRTSEEAIATVSLEEKRNTRYIKLSGGQKQRLAVACALIGKPDLLFLDEPTTGLDPQSRRQLWDVVYAFRDAGGTVLLTTHYMEEAAALCDRLMIIDHGKSIAEGTPKSLVNSLGAGHIVEVETDFEPQQFDAQVIDSLPSVRSHTWEGGRLCLTVHEPHLVLPALFDLLRAQGFEAKGLSTRHASLEDVFVHHTGRHLRDGEAGE